ncbi:MAG TPA: phosphate ABC transporter substrate-binding protein [Gemmataceae bacterium]|nr:phosphate ABC transporter substrate-binding protein [Gemmataceae bacterium]
MMPTRWLVLSGLLLAGACSGCRQQEQTLRNLVLTGSSVMVPLLRDIGKRFEAGHPGVRVDVQASVSARGVAEARQGLADIGMVARSLKPDEAMLHATPIALDAVCIIVNRTNPVETLSDDQIVRMYTRGVSNWKEVGGPDLPIVLVHMTDGRALLDLFLDHFKLRSTQIRADALIQDSAQGIQAVASRQGAIAYVSCGHAEAVHDNTPIKSLPSGGIDPTTKNIREGTYPLSRPLQLVTRDTPKGLAAEFIDFARSNAVLDLVQQHHFVTLEK